MADTNNIDQVDVRQKFVNAWNKTMTDIWEEKIFRMKAVDTGNLYHSPGGAVMHADGRFMEFSIDLHFREYGIWVEEGVGRGVDHGNTHRVDNDGWENKRKRRPWMSPKYYSSTLNMRDFMAESIGHEFVGLFANLRTEDIKKNSDYYKKKGYS